jgi:hypothetical protein
MLQLIPSTSETRTRLDWWVNGLWIVQSNYHSQEQIRFWYFMSKPLLDNNDVALWHVKLKPHILEQLKAKG